MHVIQCQSEYTINNDLENTTQKINERVTRTTLKTGPAPPVATIYLLLLQTW
jgi:hypothetical protein